MTAGHTNMRTSQDCTLPMSNPKNAVLLRVLVEQNSSFSQIESRAMVETTYSYGDNAIATKTPLGSSTVL